MFDRSEIVRYRNDDLLREAEQARLASQLGHSRRSLRHDLAEAMHRLADRLDGQPVQVQPAEPLRVGLRGSA
jgi:hypothetical protein